MNTTGEPSADASDAVSPVGVVPQMAAECLSRTVSEVQNVSRTGELAAADDSANGEAAAVAANSNGIYDFQVLDCYRELYDLQQHRGYPLLICNIASKCKYSEGGFTNLCTLYERYSPDGFSVLAFPCNQFGNAEPHNADELEKEIPRLFPAVKSIDFPIMCKVDVNGDRELPLYGYLKSCLKGTVGQTAINWNFTYFVINADGFPVARYGPEAKLEELDACIRTLLQEGEVEDV